MCFSLCEKWFSFAGANIAFFNLHNFNQKNESHERKIQNSQNPKLNKLKAY